MPRQSIPLAKPVLEGNETKYVLDCLKSGWISGSGKYVEEFEEKFADFCGAKYAVAVANGTAALHVALLALGIGPGDEVIVPDLTYIAAANAVTYCGAKPVFCDVDSETWTIKATDVERKLSVATKAVIAVHLYGHPVDMDPILCLAKSHGLHVIEDAAEAHGAEYKGRRTGALGDIATFSFYGNKIITTGEGGMITTDDIVLARQSRLIKGQGMEPNRHYWFPMVGYNYRLTNLQAAIGLAQLERIEWFIKRRHQVSAWYGAALKGLAVTTSAQAPWAKSAYWLYSICVADGVERDVLMERLIQHGIETRPFFYPMHQMPPYRESVRAADFPVSTSLATRGLNLPSSASITEKDVNYIANQIERGLQQNTRNLALIEEV